VVLERRTVSRKTPGDGRLEITRRAARLLRELGDDLPLDVGGERTTAMLGTMACTCRGAENPHEHYFLESPALKRLTPGAKVDVLLEIGGVVRVTPAES
jgi:hypothetical protein